MAKQKRKLQNTKKTFTVKVPAANRNYKDTVFRMLFSDRKNLLSLYNAVNQSDYNNPDDLEIVTLENAIYMGMKNDLAFILDLDLFLWEHQSTYNPNIPLRDLMYLAKEYEKYIKEKGISLYSNRQQKIPAPQFIVFYNGNRKIGERMEHRLSDAYETSNGEPALELKVLVININEGYNQKLMESCQILKEYAQYVSKVRTYKKTLSLNEAVEKAVEECIREGILREFLLKHRAEVVAMSIFEYDREWEEEILRKEEFEAGKEMGKELGEKLGKEEERKNTAKERHRADSEKMRADSEKMRADNAEKELLLLKEKLALLERK